MIALSVRDLDDLAGAGIPLLERDIAFNFRDRLNDVQPASLTAPNDSVIETECTLGRVVRVDVDDAPAYAFVVEQRTTHKVAATPNLETVEVSGRQLGCVVDRMALHPTRGYGRKPWARTRTFSFASPEYEPDGAWITPTVIVPSVASESAHYTGLPAGFWSFLEPWIGPSTGDDDAAPMGAWLAIYDFTLADDALVVFGMAVDDRCVVFLDGLKFAELDPGADPTSGYTTTTTAAIFLDAGAHRFAVKVINDFGSGVDPGWGEGATTAGNPTAFVMTAWSAEGGGKLIERLFGTADYTDWLILEYPDSAPGMTITQIARVIVEENQADGILTDLTVSFTDTADTDSTATPQLEAVTGQVGDSLLKLLEDWVSSGYCDWAVAPDELELSMWLYGERGSVSAVVFERTGLASTTNLVSLDEDAVDVGTDALIVDWVGGQIRVPASGGTRIAGFQTDAETVDEATLRALQAIAVSGQPTQLTAAVLPLGGDGPYTDFGLGDTVDIDDGDGVLSERVQEFAFSMGDNRDDWAVAVRDVHLTDADKINLIISRHVGGTLGALGASAPAGVAPKWGSQVRGSEIIFQPLKDAGGTIPVSLSPEKVPQASGNLYAVAVTVTGTTTTDTEFAFVVDGTDALGGSGVIAAGETFALLPVIPIWWLEGNKSRTQVDLTAVGAGLEGLLIEPRLV